MSTHTEINLETGEVVEKPMTAVEVESIAEAVAISEAKRNELAQKAAAKAALLDRLGITADEAALLLG